MLGGTNDIAEFGGSKGAGRTVIELKRKLDTGDKFDKAFSPGQAISIIWALSKNPDISLKHNVAYGEGIMTLTSGADDDFSGYSYGCNPNLAREGRIALHLGGGKGSPRPVHVPL